MVRRVLLTVLFLVAAGCIQPPPPPVSGTPYNDGIQSLRATDGVVYCTAALHTEIELLDGTLAELITRVDRFGGVGCVPGAWLLNAWVDCLTACGHADLPTGSVEQPTLLHFTQLPDYARLRVYLTGSYAGVASHGEPGYQQSNLIRCNPTPGHQQCLFQPAT